MPAHKSHLRQTTQSLLPVDCPRLWHVSIILASREEERSYQGCPKDNNCPHHGTFSMNLLLAFRSTPKTHVKIGHKKVCHTNAFIIYVFFCYLAPLLTDCNYDNDDVGPQKRCLHRISGFCLRRRRPHLSVRPTGMPPAGSVGRSVASLMNNSWRSQNLPEIIMITQGGGEPVPTSRKRDSAKLTKSRDNMKSDSIVYDHIE